MIRNTGNFSELSIDARVVDGGRAKEAWGERGLLDVVGIGRRPRLRPLL